MTPTINTRDIRLEIKTIALVVIESNRTGGYRKRKQSHWSLSIGPYASILSTTVGHRMQVNTALKPYWSLSKSMYMALVVIDPTIYTYNKHHWSLSKSTNIYKRILFSRIRYQVTLNWYVKTNTPSCSCIRHH